MTQLKTNFAIRTIDKNFRAHVETLKALWYGIYPCTDKAHDMDDWYYLRNEAGGFGVCRGKYNANLNNFKNIQDFLVWHFLPEAPKKTEAEILLDSLEEEMQQLQTKIAAVREQMLKEIKEK